jgi:CRP/FNR family transcriptional regulator, cyclic AMP receptor protein
VTDSLFIRIAREFHAGDVLFREGETGEEMYVIQSGLVQLLKRVGPDERALATLGRGEFLGEMAILNGKPRTATAVVLEGDDHEEPRDRDAPHQEARAPSR